MKTSASNFLSLAFVRRRGQSSDSDAIIESEDVLSMSFLDALSCGLGAVVMLFIMFSALPRGGQSPTTNGAQIDGASSGSGTITAAGDIGLPIPGETSSLVPTGLIVTITSELSAPPLEEAQLQWQPQTATLHSVQRFQTSSALVYTFIHLDIPRAPGAAPVIGVSIPAALLQGVRHVKAAYLFGGREAPPITAWPQSGSPIEFRADAADEKEPLKVISPR